MFEIPKFNEDKSISLEYFGGSICDKTSNRKYSTHIHFFCSNSSIDVRVYKHAIYFLLWVELICVERFRYNVRY